VIVRRTRDESAPRPLGRLAAPAAVSPSSFATADTPGRVHPLRLFYPGQTYKPEELALDPSDVGGAFVHRPSQKTRQLYKRGHAANSALLAGADFRNVRLLSAFTSDTGKLLPRRTNKVDAKVQRALVRAIKTARALAIMPYIDRGAPQRRRGA
jgi:ribosomal protein S18